MLKLEKDSIFRIDSSGFVSGRTLSEVGLSFSVRIGVGVGAEVVDFLGLTRTKRKIMAVNGKEIYLEI